MQPCVNGGRLAVVAQLFASVQSCDCVPPEHALNPVQDQFSVQGITDAEGLIETDGEGETVTLQLWESAGLLIIVPQEFKSRQT